MSNDKPTKIITVNATAQEILAWTVSAADKGQSRSKWMRTQIEKSRDMERILAEQKIAPRKRKLTRTEVHSVGKAAIELYDVNHLDG